MKQADLAILVGLKNRFRENPRQRAKSADIAQAIDLILTLFDQSAADLTALAGCIDDLARHTGYQLEEKAEEAANG